MRTSQKILLLSVLLGLLAWFLDTVFDYFFFYKGTFWGLLILEVPQHELYIRLVILACFVVFGLVTKRIVQRLQEAKSEIAAGRKWLATTLASIGDAVITTDKQGAVTFLNPTAQKLTGWSQAEAQGQPLHQVFNIVNEHTRREVENPVTKVLAAGEVAGLANHTVLLRRDGSELPIEDSGAPIKDDQGRVDGVVLVFRDVSQRRTVERERARLEAQLRQSQKLEAIGTLAGGIAHDFNNILGVIMGYSEMALRDAQQGSCDPQDLEQVLAASQRAKKLVRQILAYSRRSEADLKPLELNLLVSEAAGLLERTLPKMIQIELDLETELWALCGDPVQIEQIVMNLAANARDAMPEGGRLEITTVNRTLDQDFLADHAEVSPGDYVMLMVSDSGLGMDADTRARAFDPFFTTKEPDAGTGLGLSTVYGIVKNHGGYIDCYSEPGEGTTFKLYFPARRDHPAAAHDLGGHELPRGHERILLVEDETALRELGARALRAAGYRVQAAVNGEEALELHGQASGEVDLVVLDVNMPGMGGPRCLAALRQREPGLKVLIASGYSADNALKQIGELGVQGFVAKPFLRAELLSMVRSILDEP